MKTIQCVLVLAAGFAVPYVFMGGAFSATTSGLSVSQFEARGLYGGSYCGEKWLQDDCNFTSGTFGCEAGVGYYALQQSGSFNIDSEYNSEEEEDYDWPCGVKECSMSDENFGHQLYNEPDDCST
jgi:hypothetical protein